jgi:hypothetical protein
MLSSSYLKINYRGKIFNDNKFARFRYYVLLFKCFQINLSFKNHKNLSRSTFLSNNSGTIFWALPTANSIHVRFFTPTHLKSSILLYEVRLIIVPFRNLFQRYSSRYSQSILIIKSFGFWDITLYSPLKITRRFGGAYWLHLHGWRIINMKEAARSCS